MMDGQKASPDIPVTASLLGHDLFPAPSSRAAEMAAWLCEFFQRRVNPRLMDERRCLAPHVVLELGRHGLLGMQVPAKYGGLLDYTHVEFFWILRQLAAIDVTCAAFVGVNNCLGVRPLLRFGSAAFRDGYLPDLADGRILAAFALTEAVAGSNPSGIGVTACRMADGFQVNGEKWWSGSAQWAGVIHVIARHQDAIGRDCGYVALSLDAEAKGLRQGDEALTLGMRGMVQNKIHLDNVLVQPDGVLGSPFAGMSVAADTMSSGRIAVAAVSAGAIWRLLQLMIRYAGRRRVGGTFLYASDHVGARITEGWQAAQVIDAMVVDIARQLDQGITLPAEIYAAAKLVSSELLWSTADDAMQLLGGRAYCENNPVARIWRDARITRIFEGPSETIALYLGQQIVKGSTPFRQYLERQSGSLPVWSLLTSLLLQSDLSHNSLRSPSSARYLIALGQCAAWGVAGVFSPATETQLWITQKMRRAAETLASVASPSLPGWSTLDDLIQQRIGTIGSSETDEQVGLDDYLR